MRKNIVAGNWKMNKTFQEADDLIGEIIDNLEDNGMPEGVEIIICPPAIYLELATDLTNETPIATGAQNISQHESGAYTGEISAPMLKSIESGYTIIGHSERRKYYHEDDAMLATKVDMAIKHEIVPIFCCGELLEEREAGNHFEVVKSQLENGIFHLSETDYKKIVIAYEPVWAIGTGVTASPEQAQEMHAFIRKTIAEKYNAEIADACTILYGGSCNAKNAKELFANPDVDGGLIGGAALKAEDFCTIARSF